MKFGLPDAAITTVTNKKHPPASGTSTNADLESKRFRPKYHWLVSQGNLVRDWLGVCFVSEPLSCCLTGHTQGDCDLVPGPATCTGNVHGLTQLCFLSAKCLGNSSDLLEVVGAIHFCSVRVEFFGELFEAARGPLNLIVCVLHLIHPLSKKSVELRS